MKYDRRKGSFLFRLLLVATFLSLVAVVLYFGRSYVEYSRYRRERFDFVCDVQEKNLIEQARLVSSGLFLKDQVVDGSIRMALRKYGEHYVSSGMDPEKLDLQEVREAVSYVLGRPISSISLGLIDRDGVMIKGIGGATVGLDFKNWPPFYKQIMVMFEMKEPRVDPWSRKLSSPEQVFKYGYYPTSDGRYLLDLGVAGERSYELGDDTFSFEAVLKRASEKDPDLKFVAFINRSFSFLGAEKLDVDVQLDQMGLDSELIRNTISSVFRSESDIEIKSPDDLLLRFTYVDFNNKASASGKNLNMVLFMVSSMESLHRDIALKLRECVASVIVAFSISVLGVFALYRYLFCQVNVILEDLEIIASGDLDHRIETGAMVELRRLEKSVNKMVRRLKRNIDDLKEGSLRLGRELELRKKTEEKLRGANEALFVQANVDELTGIFNRRRIMDLLAREIARCYEDGGTFGIILFDLDKFKEVNDVMGHLFGDKALSKIGELMKDRRGVGFEGRYGGDEFIILLPEMDIKEAVEEGLAFWKKVSETDFDGVSITVSMGITSFSAGDTIESLLNRVDGLLYEAKDRRDRICSDVDRRKDRGLS